MSLGKLDVDGVGGARLESIADGVVEWRKEMDSEAQYLIAIQAQRS